MRVRTAAAPQSWRCVLRLSERQIERVGKKGQKEQEQRGLALLTYSRRIGPRGAGQLGAGWIWFVLRGSIGAITMRLDSLRVAPHGISVATRMFFGGRACYFEVVGLL